MTSFTVFSKPNCPFCDQAKALLKSKGLPYREIMLDVGQPKAEGADYISRDELLAMFPGVRTVPQISLLRTTEAGTQVSSHIGGFQELKTYLA